MDLPTWSTTRKDGLAARPQHIERLSIAYVYMGQWVSGASGGEFHVGAHIMVVTLHSGDLQGFTREGWNGTYVTHLPGANHTDLLFLVRPIRADNR